MRLTVENIEFLIGHIHGISNLRDKDGNKYKYNISEKVLFCQLENNDFLVISIKTNDDEKITEQQISELINFDIDVK